MPIESPPSFLEQRRTKLLVPDRNLTRMWAADDTLELSTPLEVQLAKAKRDLTAFQTRLLKDYASKGLTPEMLSVKSADPATLRTKGLDIATDITPLFALHFRVLQLETARLKEMTEKSRETRAVRTTGPLAPREPGQSAIFPGLTGVGRKTRKHGHTRLRRRARGRVSRRKIQT